MSTAITFWVVLGRRSKFAGSRPGAGTSVMACKRNRDSSNKTLRLVDTVPVLGDSVLKLMGLLELTANKSA